jgi:hypothetical protein
MKEHGRSSLTTLERGVNVSNKSEGMNAGWPAREEKVNLSYAYYKDYSESITGSG